MRRNVRAGFVGVIVAVAILCPIEAQQVRQNINVLPVVLPHDNPPCYLDDNLDGQPSLGDSVFLANGAIVAFAAGDEGLPECIANPDWFLEGDGFLQRQVEPTIAASTRNPNHLIAFFNDYRAVDIQDDPEPTGLAENEEENAPLDEPSVEAQAEMQLADASPTEAASSEDSATATAKQQTAPVAASEAFIGVSFSYNKGIHWSGGFLPGGPSDNSPASLASPIFGVQAGTDPIAVAAPCGVVHLVGIAFTRGSDSYIFFSSYVDSNDSESDHTWNYLGTTVIESGNNAEFGTFLDKPDAAVDVLRDGSNSDACAHNLYVSYTTFNGQASDGKIQSKVNFAKATMDSTLELSGHPANGVPVNTNKINMPFKQGQGTAIAIDPNDGTIYLVWRNFFDPHTLLVHSSANFGASFPGKPKEITKSVPLANFDQPSIPTAFASPALDSPGHRSNGFPTAAVTNNGDLWIAWQERVDLTTGLPSTDPTAEPRIVLVHSSNGGSTFQGVDPIAGVGGPRQAYDFGDRDLNCPGPMCALPQGFGFLPQARPSGPQVMPRLRAGGDRLLMTYFESRGIWSVDAQGNYDIDSTIQTVPGPSGNFITGFRRLSDLRVSTIDPTDGTLLNSTQVSRYPIKTDAVDTESPNPADPEGLEDVFQVCSATGHCVPSVNRPNIPQSGNGLIPFVGDYNALIPATDFVFDQNTGAWRWATLATDFQDQAFHAIWADNRNVAEPDVANGASLFEYQLYGPPGAGGACTNPGFRNTDVYTAQIETGTIINTPVTYKSLALSPRTFPFSLMNTQSVTRFFRLDITQGASFSSLRPPDFTPTGELNPVDVDTENVVLLPYSSSSRVAYAEQGGAGPITVTISEADCSTYFATFPDENALGLVISDPNFDPFAGLCGGAIPVGTAVFNGDPSQTGEDAIGEVTNPLVSNPLVSNPLVSNPLVSNSSLSNPLVSNPLVSNPLVSNPLVSNSSITDVEWSVANGSTGTTTLSSFPLLNIDNAEQFLDNYDFQVFLYTEGSYGQLNDAACASYGGAVDNMLSVLTTNGEKTPLVSNPLVSNPLVSNPLVSNPLVSNPLVSNPLVSNPLVSNPLVSNSAITASPSDVTSLEASAVTAPPAVMRSQGGLTDLRAERHKSVLKVLVRAVTKRELICPANPTSLSECTFCTGEATDLPSCDFVFDPSSDPPALSMVPVACDTDHIATDPDCIGLVSTAPDLEPGQIAITNADADPTDPDIDVPVSANGAVLSVDTWTLFNLGTQPATAENRPLQHGYYLSPDEALDVDGLGNIDPASGDIRLDACADANCTTVVANPPELASPDNFLAEAGVAGDMEAYSALDLFLPGDLDPGQYWLILWVDELEEVSESNEVNNYSTAIAVTDFSIQIANRPPVANDDSPPAIDEDTELLGTAPGSDPDGDALVYSLASDPSNGTVDLDAATGDYTYTPDLNWNGSDSFEYEVSDGEFSDSGTISITVTAVDDPPLAAQGIELTVDEDGSVAGTLSAEDVDGGASFSFEIISQGTLGTATLGTTVVACPPGTPASFICIDVTYVPDANANGQDQFTYRVTDLGSGATSDITVVVVIIASQKDAPVALDALFAAQEDTAVLLTLTATDGDGADDDGSFSFAVVGPPSSGVLGASSAVTRNGETFETTMLYTPTANTFGMDALTFVASDGDPETADSNVATVTIDVAPVNDAPQAVPQSVTVDQNSTTTITLSGIDIDGDTLGFGIESVPSFGQVSQPPTPVPPFEATVDYTPINGFVGQDSFVFSVGDGIAPISTAAVDITVVDPFPDDCFIGLLGPYPFPFDPTAATYAVRQGSSVPLKWQYADFVVRWPPECGAPKDTSELFNENDPPSSPFEVEITGPYSAQGNKCDTADEVGAPFVITPANPGNSTFKYSGGAMTHQLNWDSGQDPSGTPLPKGCYNIRIKRSDTGQSDGPFPIRLR